jgi:hypothetical protein
MSDSGASDILFFRKNLRTLPLFFQSVEPGEGSTQAGNEGSVVGEHLRRAEVNQLDTAGAAAYEIRLGDLCVGKNDPRLLNCCSSKWEVRQAPKPR